MERTITDSDKRLWKAVEDAVRDAKTAPGWQIPNGATLLMQQEVKRMDHAFEFIVLCVNPGFQPFMTWRRIIGAEQLADGHSFGPIDYCFEGHYHRHLDDAMTDYRERIGD